MNVRVGVGVGLDVRAYVHACVVATMMCCDVEYRSSALRISQGSIESATYVGTVVCKKRMRTARLDGPPLPSCQLFRRTDQI